MRPDVVLGFDPAPGDPAVAARVADALHKVVRGLTEARAGLDRLGPVGSVWDGALGSPVVAVLRRYSLGIGELHETLVGILTAVEAWREGLERRRSDVSRVVDQVAELAGEAGPGDQRQRLIARARELEADHQVAARDLAKAFEDLSATAERLTRIDRDLAAELDTAVQALARAVEEWVAGEGPELVRTAAALAEVAALTTVISELVGVAALDRAPGDDAGVRAVISRSPAAHRLVRALHQRWLEVAPALPEASFGRPARSTLADSIAGRLSGDGAEPLTGDAGR